MPSRSSLLRSATFQRGVGIVVVFLWAAVRPFPAGGQWAEIQVPQAFRAAPDGPLLAEVAAGAQVEWRGGEGEWSQVALVGYVRAQGVQGRPTQGSHSLVVVTPGGEPLWVEPSGGTSGRLLAGMVLEELDRSSEWVRVRRVGWVREESMEPAAASMRQAREEGSPALGVRRLPPGAPVLATPDGDTIALSVAGAELSEVARQGDWVRVRIEGWVRVPEPDRDPAEAIAPAVLGDVTPLDLIREGERLHGRVVQMELQYISLERAELVRGDFYEGEPFLLTRGLDPDRTFVYLAVTPSRLGEVGSLSPLETIRVLARVRTASAALTGNPILDLMELDRLR